MYIDDRAYFETARFPDDNSMPSGLLAYVGLERPNLICLIAMHDLRRLRSFVAPKEIIVVGP
jgi:hypothetical protein